MPSASELARAEEERTDTPESEDAQRYRELRDRAGEMGFATVGEALDHLADVLRGEL